MKTLESKPWARLLMPSITDVIIFVVFILAIAPVADYDTWWHLKTGEYILANGLPSHDVFSYTATDKPWTLHEWLTEVVFFSLYSTFGLNILAILTALSAALTCGIVFRSMAMGRNNIFLALLLIVPVGVCIGLMWTPRPHLFSILFLSIFVLVLRQFRLGINNRLWLLPVIMILWVNLHGGFILGLVVVFITLFGESLKRVIGLKEQALKSREVRYLAKVFLITLLAALINPYTYEILFYPLQYLGDNIHTQFITEWAATNFRNYVVLEALILLLMLSLILSRKRKDLTDLVYMFVFLHLSLTTVRYIPFFAIIIAPILAYHLNDALSRSYQKLVARDSRVPWGGRMTVLRNYLVSRSEWVSKLESLFNKHILLLLAILTASVLTLGGHAPVDMGICGANLPVNATDFLQEHKIEGNMFNEYAWGGYLIWNLYPKYRVFVDGRADVYGEEFLLEYSKIVDAKQNWTDTLDKYEIDFIVYPSGSSLVGHVKDLPGWVEVFRDGKGSIVVKNTVKNTAVLKN